MYILPTSSNRLLKITVVINQRNVLAKLETIQYQEAINTSYIRHIQDLMSENIHLLNELLKTVEQSTILSCNCIHIHIIWRKIGQILGKSTTKI